MIRTQSRRDAATLLRLDVLEAAVDVLEAASAVPLAAELPVLLGMGDSAELTFDLPEDGVLFCAAMVDGIVQSASTWSISAGTGPGGVDQLVFGVGNAPDVGQAVEVIAWS